MDAQAPVTLGVSDKNMQMLRTARQVLVQLKAPLQNSSAFTLYFLPKEVENCMPTGD